MHASVEHLPKSQVRLRINVSAEEARPFVERAARELATEHPPKGFRPGTAPLALMRKVVGDAAILERALKSIVQSTYVSSIQERLDIDPLGQPSVTIEKAGLEEEIHYTAEVAVLPEVKLGDYRRVAAMRRPVTVEKTEVERELETIRAMRASYLTVPRPAQKGDRVELRLRATVGTNPLHAESEEQQYVLLGEGYLLPGFEEQIVGMSSDATKTFSLAVPEQHHRADLRGKTIDFRVTVTAVQQRILPTLDDAFAKNLGSFESVQNLQTKLEENLRQEKAQREDERYQQELIQEIAARATFGEFPAVLIEQELHNMLAELQSSVADMGLSFETYLAQIKKRPEELMEQMQPKAVERIRAGLTLRAIAHAERITVTEEEVAEEVNTALQQFQSPEDARKKLDLERLREVVAGTIRNRKVFSFLERTAR